jgi:hypothetical protein
MVWHDTVPQTGNPISLHHDLHLCIPGITTLADQSSLAKSLPALITKVATSIPFYFIYDNQPSRQLLPCLKLSEAAEARPVSHML